MKRILTFVVSLLIFLPSFAQQYVVDGNIYDATSKEPLFYATASLFTPKGTLLLSQQTDSVGHFKLSTFHPGKYKLKLSYVGYDKLEKEILFTLKQPTLHYDSLHLNSIEVQLKEAIVKATAARVQQKGDTTQYNASAYRTPVGSTLKSLIKQLPGVEVKDDGGILFHGKKINQFLINGKDFFKSKTDVAMDNLPVELVKNIKAYSKKSEHAEQTGTDDEEENHVLDITTKKEFKRTLFSVFNLGYGRKERYQINSFTSRFTENSRISTFFDCNNTRGYSGHPNTKSIGTDFSFSNGKKKYTSGYLELEGNAFYHYNGNNLFNETNSQTFLSNNKSSFRNSENLNKNRNINFQSEIEAIWSPDSMTVLTLRPEFSHHENSGRSESLSGTFNEDPYSVLPEDTNPLSHIFSENIAPELSKLIVNRNNNVSKTLGRNNSIGGNLDIVRRFKKKKRNLSFSARGNYTKGYNKNFNISNTDFYREGTLRTDFRNQYVYTPPKSYNYGIKLEYNEPISKYWRGEVSYEYNFRYNKNDRSRYILSNIPNSEWDDMKSIANIGLLPDDDKILQQVRDDKNSRYTTYHYHNQNIKLSLRHNTDKSNLKLGFNLQPQRTTLDYLRPGQKIDTVIKRNVFNIAPNLRWRYKFNKYTTLRMTYRGNPQQPSMTDLIAVVDDSNPLNISMGNPGLKPSWSNNMDISFDTYNSETQSQFSASTYYRETKKSISTRITYDEKSGIRYTRPENINGNWSSGIRTGFTLGMLKERRLTLSSWGSFNFNHHVSYVNNMNIPKTTSISYLYISPLTREQHDMEYYENIFSNTNSVKNIARTYSFSEQLRLNYRITFFDISIKGSVNYQNASHSNQENRNLSTWRFSYGGETNWDLMCGTSFSTDVSISSRRGYNDHTMNTNEVIWNANISQNFDFWLKGLTLRFRMTDILQQRSNISRILNSNMRKDSRNNTINTYGLLILTYRLNLTPGVKFSPFKKGKSTLKKYKKDRKYHRRQGALMMPMM